MTFFLKGVGVGFLVAAGVIFYLTPPEAVKITIPNDHIGAIYEETRLYSSLKKAPRFIVASNKTVVDTRFNRVTLDGGMPGFSLVILVKEKNNFQHI